MCGGVEDLQACIHRERRKTAFGSFLPSMVSVADVPSGVHRRESLARSRYILAIISPHTDVPAPVTDQHFTDSPTMATVPTCVNLRWRHGRESRMAFTPPAGAINGCGAAGWPGCLRATRRWTHPIWRTRNFFADFPTLPTMPTTTDPRGLAWRRERRLRRIKTTHLPPPRDATVGARQSVAAKIAPTSACPMANSRSR